MEKKEPGTNEVFERCWRVYPKKLGKKAAYKHYLASVKTKQDEWDIQNAVAKYAMYCLKNNTEEQYIQHGKTFFNNWRDWVEYEFKQDPKQTLQDKFNASRK